MIFVEAVTRVPVGRVVRSYRYGEGTQACDAERRMAHAVALEASAAEDSPSLQADEAMLGSCEQSLVGSVRSVLPSSELALALRPAVQHHQAVARLAAVHDDHRGADCIICPAVRPRLAVAAVAGQWPADHDDESGASVDDEPTIVRAAVILRLIGDRAGAVRAEVPPTMRTTPVTDRLPGGSGNLGPKNSMIPPGRQFGDIEEQGVLAQRQVRAPGRRDEQHRPSSRQHHGRPRRSSSATSQRTAATELPKQRGLSRPVNGASRDDSDAVSTPAHPKDLPAREQPLAMLSLH